MLARQGRGRHALPAVPLALQTPARSSPCLPPLCQHALPAAPSCADSRQVITACDDNHAHLYDAEHAELIEAFSGGLPVHSSCLVPASAAGRAPFRHRHACRGARQRCRGSGDGREGHSGAGRVGRGHVLGAPKGRDPGGPCGTHRAHAAPAVPRRRARVLGAVCQRAPQRRRLCHRQQRRQGQAVGPGHADMRAGGQGRAGDSTCAAAAPVVAAAAPCVHEHALAPGRLTRTPCGAASSRPPVPALLARSSPASCRLLAPLTANCCVPGPPPPTDGCPLLCPLQPQTLQTCSEHGDQVWSVRFRPDGARLASVSDDRSVCLFDFAA